MAKRVTVDHLQALIEAVELAEEFFATADPDDPQNDRGFHAIRLASEATGWLRREIERRQGQKLVRDTLREIARSKAKEG